MDTRKARKLFSEFFKTGKRQVYTRRSTIIPYNYDMTNGYMILEGCVKVVSHTENGSERIHYLYGPGEFFPVTWVLGNVTYDVEFSAFTQVTVMTKSLESIRRFFETNPISLLDLLEQQTAACGRIINLNLGDAEQRVAYRMTTLAQRFGRKVDDHFVIDMNITMQELADMVRLTRETVGKIVADFEKKGYLIMGRNKTVVYDALKAIAG